MYASESKPDFKFPEQSDNQWRLTAYYYFQMIKPACDFHNVESLPKSRFDTDCGTWEGSSTVSQFQF